MQQFLNQLTRNILIFSMLISTPTFAINDIVRLENWQWLVSSEDKGLELLNDKFELIATYKGQYKNLDARMIDFDKQLILAINHETNNLDYFLIEQNSIRHIDSVAETQNGLETVCLSRSEADGAIYAFVALNGKAIEQRLVYDLSKQQVNNLLIRQIPMIHDIGSCQVDDKNKFLYLGEESVGVWKYGADPEAEINRTPIAMIEPFGNIQSEIKNLSILPDGSLLVSQHETSHMGLYQGDELVLIKGDFEQAEILAGDWISGKLLSLVYLSEQGTWTTKNVQYKRKKGTNKKSFNRVQAIMETKPVQKTGDAADDPAIWFNSTEPKQSLILGTDKKSGLGVYDLAGNQTQFLASGRLNNVDVRSDIQWQGTKISLAAASNRDKNSITLFSISEKGFVEEVADIYTKLTEVYGLCMYQDKQSTYVFINDKDGRYQQYNLNLDRKQITTKLVREFKVIDQPEGCVANDETGHLYVGVEDEGVWITSAKPDTKKSLKKIISIGGPIKDDVEGLGLYKTKAVTYLVVSSQGNNSYAFYTAGFNPEYLGSVQVVANYKMGIDGASETDGLEVSSLNFGGALSQGMMVVQDGRNVLPNQPQNFKVVPFSAITKSLNLR